MYEYFELRKHWSEWISTHEIALENATRIGDRAVEGTLLVRLGIAHMQSMRLEDAMALYRRALPIFRTLGDRVGFGWALNYLGWVLRNLGRPHFAMLCHQWALRLFQDAGNGHLEGSALHNIAMGHRLLGRLDIAVEFHLQNVTNHRRLGERLHTGRALDFLGVVYRELGRLTEAIDCHRENLDICRELLDVHGAARGRSNLAVTYREAGRLPDAIACHLDALRTFRVTGPAHREGVELVELGRTYRRAGHYGEAARSWSEALAILDTLPGPGSELAGQTRAALAEIDRVELSTGNPETSGTQVSDGDERTHEMTPERFSQFCAGPVDAETVTMLRDGQYSRRRLLLSALIGELNGRDDAIERAWRVLAVADRAAPAVLADVLMSPLVGVWLVRILRRLRGAAADGPALPVELGFLVSLAGAVAIRARVPCVLRVPAVDGAVTLPTVGQVRFGTATVFTKLTVAPDGVAVTLAGTDRVCPVPGGAEFFPVHRLAVVAEDLRLDVEIDDSTSYREFTAPIPPRPLTPADLDALATRLEQTWEILVRWHPETAAELAAGIATLTPRPSSSKVVGSSSPMAFGAVAASTDGSPDSLAATLVHEFQHSKLNAVLDLVHLHTDSGASWYVPWRDDPRPLSGVLHGVYAFVSGVEFWCVRRRHVADVAAATFRYAYRHKQVSATVDAVRHSQDLTGPGRELVAAVARRLDRCALDDVPAEVVDLIDTVMVEHRAIWRLRHLRPDTDHVDEVVAAWFAEQPAPAADNLPDMVIPFRRTVPSSARTALLMAGLPGPSAGDEDHAFAANTYDEAATGYMRRLSATPDDGDAWVGLGLTLRGTGDTAAARALLDTPETASTAWQRLARESTAPPSPVEFGRWLGGG
jgi:HEXXH motif-containing protein